jgi:hypothetical protein
VLRPTTDATAPRTRLTHATRAPGAHRSARRAPRAWRSGQGARLRVRSRGLVPGPDARETQRADTLDGLVAQRAAAQQIDRDSPAVNLAEGRLQFAMRPLWDNLAEGRADGVTALMLALSPTLLRALNIKTARKTVTA